MELPQKSSKDRYSNVIADAKRCTRKSGGSAGFPQEWDGQLLVDCGRLEDLGVRLVLFTPAILHHVLDDDAELDRALQFLLLRMDKIAMHEKYMFVYCHSGMSWSNAKLAERLRITYDILPKRYRKKLTRFVILHPTIGFRCMVMAAWAWLSKRVWGKIEYFESLDKLVEDLTPQNSVARAELRRRFPQLVQREDAMWLNLHPPTTFGVPLKELCDSFGVQYLDRATMRLFPRLPPAIIFLCEALERQAGDESFPEIFATEADHIYDLVASVDAGLPLDPELPVSTLWCALKLFLDCLPQPLLSFQAFAELGSRKIEVHDRAGHRNLLRDALHKKLPIDAAFTALYVASFLRHMCRISLQRAKIAAGATDQQNDEFATAALTPLVLARVFAPGFVRPRQMNGKAMALVPTAVALVETLIRSSADDELWVGRLPEKVSQEVAAEEESDGHSTDRHSDSNDSDSS